MSCFPRKSPGSFKKAARSFSRGSAAASEVRVYIQDVYHDKENFEGQDYIEKISSEESVNSQEVEETPQKRSVSLNVHRSRRAITSKQAAALFRRDKFILLQVCITGSHFSAHIFTRKEPGTSCSREFACATAGELSLTITNFFGRLTM